MIIRKTGKPNILPFLKKASTAFAIGGLVNFDGSGYLQPGSASTDNHIGLNFSRTVVSTDSDYATATQMLVDVPGVGDVFEADVSAGTATIANVGVRYDLNTTGVSVDLTGTTNGAVTVIGVVSASKVLIIINSLVNFKNT